MTSEELKKQSKKSSKTPPERHEDFEKIPTNTDKLSDMKKQADKNNKEKLSEVPKEKDPSFKPYTFQNLLDMPSKEWLLDQVFGAGDIGMFYGAPGCGKTFVVIDMIIKLCTGKKWANTFDVSRCLNIAYCAGEGISGLPSRFSTAAKHYDVSSLSNFTFYKTIPQLYTNGNDAIVTIKQFSDEWVLRQLKEEAEALDVLVIDTLHTATTGADENSAQDMGAVLRECRFVAEKLGCAVILVHHTNKGGTSERGSSALRGAMDFMIEIKRDKDTGTDAVMSCAKLKDGEQWKYQNFNLEATDECDSVHVQWNGSNDGKSVTNPKTADKNKLLAEMERYVGKPFTSKSLSEVIAQSSSYTIKLLKELVSEKKCKTELKDPSKEASSRNPWIYLRENPTENRNYFDH